MKNYKVDTLKQAIASANSVMLVVPQITADSLVSALSFGLCLKKAGKAVTVFSPQNPDAGYSKIAGYDLLTSTIGNSDLTITLDYPLANIEKVSYNDNGGKLNLVVEVKQGSPQVENNQINVAGQTALADLFIMLGDETQLGDKQTMVNSGEWALLTPTQNPASPKTWAKHILLDENAPFSEMLPFLVPMLGLELVPEACRNLISALRAATGGFIQNITPETFEAGAICLRISQNEAVVQQQAQQLAQMQSQPTSAPLTQPASPAPTVAPSAPVSAPSTPASLPTV